MAQPSLRIAIIVGSTRPGRNATAVAEWTHSLAQEHGGAEFQLIDIANYDLPMLDEPLGARASATMGLAYDQPHTTRWSKTIASFDGFVFVTPEYNHAPPAALKNALDYLYAEWANKAAAFVSYGADGGVRAVMHLRNICGELQLADVRNSVSLSLLTDFVDYTSFRPASAQAEAVKPMLDQLLAWSTALKLTRANPDRAERTAS